MNKILTISTIATSALLIEKNVRAYMDMGRKLDNYGNANVARMFALEDSKSDLDFYVTYPGRMLAEYAHGLHS